MARPDPAALARLAVAPLAMPEPAAVQPAHAPFAHWRLVVDTDGVAWATLDKAATSTNTLSRDVLGELDRLLDAARAASPKGLVVRSAKANGFAAGAEIGEFADLAEPAAAVAAIEAGLAVLDKLAAFPAPTVALLHGFCLGGGLELALACRWRIARADTRLGFPEVLLGLHPGLGGTWRSLAVADPLAAMTAMLTGSTLPAPRARRAGLVDVVTEERHFAEAVRRAVAGTLARADSRGLKARLVNLAPVRHLIARRMAREAARKAPPAHYPAPSALIGLWRDHGADPAALRPAETRSFAHLLAGETSRNLVRAFFLRERLKGYAKGAESGIARVHVIGAGVMGGDIAAWCALRGHTVTLQDRETRFIAPAVGRAARLYRRRLHAEVERRAALDRLIPDVAGDGLARADLVIEAVPESLDIKRAVYEVCERRMRPDAILATNTSSILLETLTDGLAHPARFCGIHFFNPVDRMPLVEVVTHAGLSGAVRDRVVAFVAGLDKLPLPVASSPGFLVNRALVPYMMEAFLLHAEGMAPEAIDAAMEAFGMPMGPIELADQVGLDVGLHVAEVVKRDLPQPLPEIAPWLRDLVAAGRLGRKTGHGIYVWKDGKPVKRPVAEVPGPAVQDRLVLPMLNAVADCLAEGVVASPDDADAGMIYATGFAPFRGGPLHYARRRGVAEVVAALEALRAVHGDRFAPSPGWSKVG